MKESESKEQLYICDHAEECNQNCTSGVAHIKTTGCGCKSCNFFDEPVKCIPYKEEPEGSEYIHIADGLEDEKSEPKTKKVAVVWFGEVPVDRCENPMLIDEMTGYVYDQVELIDPARLRYGGCEKDETYIKPTGIDIASHTFKNTVCLIIDPPKQETVEDVMKRMPDYNTIPASETFNWLNDLKAAQEREETK